MPNLGSARSTTKIDVHVGARIHELRILRGLTLKQLAELIGVVYEQVHKYERGINRVYAGRLYDIACVLEVPIGYFFDGLGEDEAPRPPTPPHEIMQLNLVRNFVEIPKERHREAFAQMARALANK